MKLIAIVLLVLCNGSKLPASGAGSPANDRLAIVNFEERVVKADNSHDIAFYLNNLTSDWTAGTSWGTWYSKPQLLADLRDEPNNHVNRSSISGLKVRVYGDAAIATFAQTYDAIVLGRHRLRNVINTDTFIRQNGRWMLWASHTSMVPQVKP